jgi:ATP-dependent DNA helicase RecG
MGVDDGRKVLGTSYKNHHASLQKLKRDIAPHTALNFTFENIFAVRHSSGKRVLLFQIPAAPCGVPMSWKGHFFGRDHESTVALKQNEYDAIRGQASLDWSSTVSSEATLEGDIDAEALLKAREGFKEKNPRFAAECDGWSDAIFLSKLKLVRAGKLTFAALLLVGKGESAHLLSPADASIFWVRKRADGTNADYESFAPPFVLSVDDLFARVKNDRHQFMRDGTLFPIDILQYDGWVIREMLHNAIAHQDYRQNRRINVVEQEGTLQFTNAGSFQPGSVEKWLKKIDRRIISEIAVSLTRCVRSI